MPTVVPDDGARAIRAALARWGHHLVVRGTAGVTVALCVLAASLSSCSSGSVNPPRPSPSPSHSASVTPAVIANCEKPEVAPTRRPSRIVAACGGDAVFILTDIRYSGWAARRASGTAHVRYNSCRPYCAAGHLVTGLAIFQLDSPRQVRGRLVFTTVSVHSRSGPHGRYPLGDA